MDDAHDINVQSAEERMEDPEGRAAREFGLDLEDFKQSAGNNEGDQARQTLAKIEAQFPEQWEEERRMNPNIARVAEILKGEEPAQQTHQYER